MAFRNLTRRVSDCGFLYWKQHFVQTNPRNIICQSNVKFLHTEFERRSKLTVPSSSHDILMQNFRSATDSLDVLENVQQHHSIMNDDHVVQALTSIFILLKSNKSSMTNGEIVRNKTFNLLCKVLLQKVRFLELNDHLNALKALSFIGVPATSKITQVLLQLLAKQVNSLNLQQLVFVEFIIKDYTQCPLVDALLIAIPIVFEARLTQLLRELDPKHASDLFMYATKKKLSKECIDSFINYFNDHIEELDLDICRNVIRALSDTIIEDFSHRNLLHVCLDFIIDNSNQLSFYDLNYILARITCGNRNVSQFYHEEFLNCCAKYVIDHKCDVEQATLVLRTCNRFVHLHKELIDYVDQKIIENPSQLEKWTVGMLLTSIESMAIADYRPDGFENYKHDLIQAMNKFTGKVTIPWFKTALNLCALDCWPKDFFNLIFEEGFLKRFLKRDHTADAIEVLEVFQAVSTLCPSYSGNLPSDHMLETLINTQKMIKQDMDSPILGALQSGLSGSSYVCSSLYTKLGHFIDHVVVMRKGGYPVAINQDVESSKSPINVEDLPSRVPGDSNMILILYLRPSSYTANTERIKGQEILRIRVLESMGYSVLPVMHSVWQNLHDTEKIPYLMQNLKNKSSSSEISQEAVL